MVSSGLQQYRVEVFRLPVSEKRTIFRLPEFRNKHQVYDTRAALATRFATTELASLLRIKESARTLGVVPGFCTYQVRVSI